MTLAIWDSGSTALYINGQLIQTVGSRSGKDTETYHYVTLLLRKNDKFYFTGCVTKAWVMILIP